jgi:hypothetical protein
MEAVRISEMSVNFKVTTRRRENLKSHTCNYVWLCSIRLIALTLVKLDTCWRICLRISLDICLCLSIHFTAHISTRV